MIRRVPALVALLLAACSSGTVSPNSSPLPIPTGSPIAAPSNLVTGGTLTIASDLDYPPQEYLDDNGKAAGLDIDMARAIAAVMNLKLAVVNINVDGIVPGFVAQDRRYDMGISAQPDSEALDNSAKTLPYFVAGLAIMVPSGNPKTIRNADGLCGLKVGSERDSSGDHALLMQNARPCKDTKIDVHEYSTDIEAVKDLQAGKLDAIVDDYPVAVWLKGKYPPLQVVPHQFSATQDVMVFPSTDDKVYNAVSAAFDRLRRSGSYHQLLDRWDLLEGALS